MKFEQQAIELFWKQERKKEGKKETEFPARMLKAHNTSLEAEIKNGIFHTEIRIANFQEKSLSTK